MNIFVDLHHASLYHSLYLLFEKRLGHRLYRAIGEEWWKEGYWHVYNHPHTVNQFLGLHQATEMPLDVHGEPLPESERKNLHYVVEDGIYYIKDLVHNQTHRAITLEKFKNMKFDIVISSIPQHIAPFNLLIQRYQPHAKHIFQIGNAWGRQTGVSNILASTSPFSVPPEINIAFYHQEFDLDVFRYSEPTFHNVVHSYVHYMKRPELMDQYRNVLPGWQFTKYGAGMEVAILEAGGVADAMRRSGFTWHYKPEGDGYGYVIHSSYACGRPAIIWGDFYRGKLGGQLLEDQVTCIDIGKHNFEDSLSLINKFSQPEEHVAMCEAAYNRFNQTVNFDHEFEVIKKFLENLR